MIVGQSVPFGIVAEMLSPTFLLRLWRLVDRPRLLVHGLLVPESMSLQHLTRARLVTPCLLTLLHRQTESAVSPGARAARIEFRDRNGIRSQRQSLSLRLLVLPLSCPDMKCGRLLYRWLVQVNSQLIAILAPYQGLLVPFAEEVLLISPVHFLGN